MISHLHGSLSLRKKVLLNLLTGCIYVLAGYLGLLLTGPNGFPIFWPAAGAALALALQFGILNILPGLAAGIILVTLYSSSSNLISCGLMLSFLLECIMAAVLLENIVKGNFKLRTLMNIFTFIMIAVLLSPFVSSTLAAFFIHRSGTIEVVQLTGIWWELFTANSLGILLLTPLILSLFSTVKRKGYLLEALISFAGLVALSDWALGGEDVRKFLIIPMLTWISLRYSFKGTSIAAMMVGSVAIWHSRFHLSVFENASPEMDLLLIQGMTAGIALGGYFMSTVSEAHKSVSLGLKDKQIAEEALAILDQSLHNSPIGFALVDQELRFIRINESLTALHRKAPFISQFHIPHLKKVFATGESLMNHPFKWESGKGAVVSGLVSYYAVKRPGTSEIIAVGVSFQDISELLSTQNLLKENEERLNLAQEAGKIGAFEWDMESNRILWTPELEHIYGLEPGEFGGFYQSWLKWVHPDDAPSTIEKINKVIQQKCELSHQFRIITKHGDKKWILARGKVVKDAQGLKSKFIGINIDVTEQKEIEQKLRVTEANLLHALSVRDEFLAIASHELKTPLTSLKLQMQFFHRGVLKNDPLFFTQKKIQSMAEKNNQEVDRLTRLVDDMLDISRLRTGKLTLQKEECEFSQMVHEVVLRTKPQFESLGPGQAVIVQAEEAWGEWDPLRIEQVITNIVTNAARYGQGKPVTIAIKNYDGIVRLSVKDEGLGIAKSDQEKIFQRFERGLLAREVSGLGLGLFITQQIVEAHGGRIWVESEITKGSTFFVDLPTVQVNKTLVSGTTAIPATN